MSIIKYNNIPFSDGINDTTPSLHTTYSGTKVEGIQADLQRQIDTLKGKLEYIGILQTALDPEDPIQEALKTELNNFVQSEKGRAAQDGDLVNVVTTTGESPTQAGSVVYSNGWEWYTKGSTTVNDASFTEKGVVKLASAITQSNMNVPTAGVVYDEFAKLDYTMPSTVGVYIKYVSQTDGQLGAISKNFDTVVNELGDDGNAPTTKAVYEALNKSKGFSSVTQAEYDAIATKDPDILYLINDAVPDLKSELKNVDPTTAVTNPVNDTLYVWDKGNNSGEAYYRKNNKWVKISSEETLTGVSINMTGLPVTNKEVSIMTDTSLLYSDSKLKVNTTSALTPSSTVHQIPTAKLMYENLSGFTIPKMHATSVLLDYTLWNNFRQTVAVENARVDSVILVGAITDLTTYDNCKIQIASYESALVTFSCDSVPTTNLYVNIIIFNPTV